MCEVPCFIIYNSLLFTVLYNSMKNIYFFTLESIECKCLAYVLHLVRTRGDVNQLFSIPAPLFIL